MKESDGRDKRQNEHSSSIEGSGSLKTKVEQLSGRVAEIQAELERLGKMDLEVGRENEAAWRDGWGQFNQWRDFNLV
jgi:hypothetical protein